MIIVERATEDDLAQIYAIDAALDGQRAEYLTQAVIKRQCILARIGAEGVGFLIWDKSFFGYPFIALLGVHPAHWRKGVGTALMQYVEKTTLDEKLFTAVNESNLKMQRLCEKLGFVRSGSIENLDEGDPKLIYFKQLVR